MTNQPNRDSEVVALAVTSDRLVMIPATADMCRAAARLDRGAMSSLIGAEIAEDWPPDLLQDALDPTADALDTGTVLVPWCMWWILLRSPRMLIGTFGFKSEPRDGRVDLGYSIVNSQQRRGYATEATAAMIRFALADTGVDCLVAETLAELTPSIRVLEKLGFSRCAEGVTGFSGEENVVRYELARAAWADFPAGPSRV